MDKSTTSLEKQAGEFLLALSDPTKGQFEILDEGIDVAFEILAVTDIGQARTYLSRLRELARSIPVKPV